jgi:hypothetical protein
MGTTGALATGPSYAAVGKLSEKVELGITLKASPRRALTEFKLALPKLPSPVNTPEKPASLVFSIRNSVSAYLLGSQTSNT